MSDQTTPTTNDKPEEVKPAETNTGAAETTNETAATPEK
jgi:hypothetical protein